MISNKDRNKDINDKNLEKLNNFYLIAYTTKTPFPQRLKKKATSYETTAESMSNLKKNGRFCRIEINCYSGKDRIWHAHSRPYRNTTLSKLI